MWGPPEGYTFTHLHAHLRKGVAVVEAFRAAVEQGDVHPALARLLVWEREQARPARLPPQPRQQVQAWLDDTRSVIQGLRPG